MGGGLDLGEKTVARQQSVVGRALGERAKVKALPHCPSLLVLVVLYCPIADPRVPYSKRTRSD
jgi:hypothetical protein